MLIKLSAWLCIEVRTQDEVIVKSLITVPLKGGKSSNIWEKQHIKILFKRKKEQIEFKKCLSFGAESVVFQVTIVVTFAVFWKFQAQATVNI